MYNIFIAYVRDAIFFKHETAIGNVRFVRIKYVQMHFTKPRISHVYQ